MNHKGHKRPLSRRDKKHWLFILGQNYKLLFFRAKNRCRKKGEKVAVKMKIRREGSSENEN